MLYRALSDIKEERQTPMNQVMYMPLKEGFQKLDLFMVEGLCPEADPRRIQLLSSVLGIQ